MIHEPLSAEHLAHEPLMLEDDGAVGETEISQWDTDGDTVAWKSSASDLRQTISELLGKAVRDGIIPGGVVTVSQGGCRPIAIAVGSKFPGGCEEALNDSSSAAMTLDTVFDLGSLTAGICTATILMRLLAREKLGINDRASRFIQGLGIGEKSLITLTHLLTHTSGFTPGTNVYDEIVRANAGPRPGLLKSGAGRQFGYNTLHAAHLKFEPGSKRLVSDTNTILAGEICELVTGVPLDKAFAKFVAGPLGLLSTGFIDLSGLLRRGITPDLSLFAPTGECGRRGRLIVGEVWHEGTWAMGGMSGYSGLFGVAHDVHSWGRELLKAHAGNSALIPAEMVRLFWEPQRCGVASQTPLVFDPSSKEGGFIEAKLAPRAVTLTSQTGCSVFLDPDSDVAITFLSNAGWLGGDRRRFATLQAVIHNSLMGLLR